MRALFSVRALFIVFSFIASFDPSSARAWGLEGHQIIAQVAENRLTPEARRIVSQMLSGETLASVSNWADQIRLNRPETRRWHFINFTEGGSGYVPERDCATVLGEGDCIVAAIERAMRDMKRLDSSSIDALKFLVHFVGDIHQPLHAIGTLRGATQLRVTFFGKRTNLHSVWDSDLIQRTGRMPAQYVAYLEKDWMPAKDLAGILGGTPVDWAFESVALGHDALVAQEAALTDKYFETFSPIVDKQLTAAGVRLAAILNEILR